MTKDYTDYFKNRDWVHMLGFSAPDWKKFMVDHNRLFGSGPFFYTTNTFGKLIYRGEEVPCQGMEFHACYGSWGSHSIEVVSQSDWSVPTMFTEFNEEGKPGLNHIHMFVEDLGEAKEACEALGIPIVTIGYPDLENALQKARATGMSEEAVREKSSRPSFMVADMRDQLGFAVQFIEPSAKRLHDAILNARDKWDGSEETMFIHLG